MNNFLKELRNALIIGVSIFMVFLVIDYTLGNSIQFDRSMLIEFCINMIYTLVLYSTNRVVFIYYYSKYQFDRFTLAHLVYGILAGVVITLVTIFFLNGALSYFIKGISLSEYLANQNPGDYTVSFLISIVVTTIYYAVFYYRYKKENQVKEQKIIAGRASAQFDALKNQLDPHFLFNSLNVLTSLIEEAPGKAVRFTTSLSKVYRYVLEQKNKALVPVFEELRFAKTYMELLKMRFEDSLVLDIPDEVSDPEAKVVPLSLQLLLENAVKHNHVTPSDKLYISIKEESGYLFVENNHQPKQIVKKGSGVGLTNIKARYGLLSEKTVVVSDRDSYFNVGIPLLTKEVGTVMLPDKYMEDKRYARAKEHVGKLRGFYSHLGAYTVIAVALIMLNVFTTSFPWAIFPVGGWGLGVFFHAAAIFEWNPIFGKSWEERKIRHLMNRDDKR